MNNALSLRKLREEGTVKIQKFDDSVLKVLFGVQQNVVAEIGSGDDLSRKIYASYQQFRASIVDWSDISVHAYLNGRISVDRKVRRSAAYGTMRTFRATI